MNALGLQFSARSAGYGIMLNTHVPQNPRKCEYNNSVRVTDFRGQGLLARGKRIGHSEIKRSERVFASTGADTQSVGISATNVDSNDQGTKHAVLEKPNEESGNWKFNWNTEWYPVAVAKDLDKDAPHAATILGRPLAIWWDKSSNKWQVYADQCPHRLAPLSEGSISEDGLLRCSYHGWTFKGDSGECTHIPQAPRDGKQLHASKRACVSVYPSMEQQGIIWFWPDLSQGAVNIEAAVKPPPIIPELSDPTFVFDLSSRDLEYRYELLIENLMDPSHVPFAHHKIQGNRANAGPMNFKVTSKITPAGFKGEDERGDAIFHAPCCFILALTVGGKKKEEKTLEKAPKKISLVFLCIPVSPGRSRVIWSFPRNFAIPLFKAIPRWILHMTNNLILDSDSYLLHLQERRIQQHGDPSNWSKRYYAPTTADAYVHAFYKWLNNFAGGAPDWGGKCENELPPSPPKRIILDRYWTHVVKCKSCSSALRGFRALEVGLQALAVALVGLVAASAVVPIRPVAPLSVPLVIGAVLSTILSRCVAHFIYKNFYFHDYNHAAIK